MVLGASGLVGGLVFKMLQTEGYDAVGASRTPRGDRWRVLDLLDPKTFSRALQDIATVMLISAPGDEAAHLHGKSFIESMLSAGVERVVVLSALGAGLYPELSNRKVELLVEETGLSWTHVRPNFFLQMLSRPPLCAEIAKEDTLSLPLGNARMAYVDARDVAAVLFRALTDPALAGRALEVSGSEALTHEEIVAHISRKIGRTIRYVALSEPEARVLLQSRGYPDKHIARILGFYALCRQGHCAQPDHEIAKLLGRPLRTLNDEIEENYRAWLPS